MKIRFAFLLVMVGFIATVASCSNRPLSQACRNYGAALLLVSHDPAALARFERVVKLDDINRAAASPGAASG